MKILLAPDSFKDSLTALEVCESIEKGIKNYKSDILVKSLPMADGGEGTVRSLVDATGGKIIKKVVTGPLGKDVKAFYGILGDKKTGVIEMASASGLPLVPQDKRNPSRTTTFGTGELIKATLEHNIEKLIIGIGGSATTDGGVGMAQALGVEFLDKNNKEIGFGGENLKHIDQIKMDNLDQRIKELEILVACDVDNPLYGKKGAAYVYSPQKGADERMVEKLDENLRHFNKVVKEQLNKNVNKIKGAGAAGGLGAGLVAFLDAELKNGIDITLDIVNFDQKIKGVDLIITGEGMLDGQTVYGKTPIGVAKRAKEHHIPVVAVAGSLGEGVEKVLNNGIDSYFSIVDKPDTLEKIISRTENLLTNLSEQIIRTYLLEKKG
ncbi:MAG: glycerate kinase [Halanaerobiales bacterium]